MLTGVDLVSRQPDALRFTNRADCPETSGITYSDKTSSSVVSSVGFMALQFLLLVIAVLLFLIFWELSKINTHLKKRCPTDKKLGP